MFHCFINTVMDASCMSYSTSADNWSNKNERFWYAFVRKWPQNTIIIPYIFFLNQLIRFLLNQNI